MSLGVARLLAESEQLQSDVKALRASCLAYASNGECEAALRAVETFMEVDPGEESLESERRHRLATVIRLCNELALICMQPDAMRLTDAHEYLAWASRNTSASSVMLRSVTLNSLGIYFMRSGEPQTSLRCLNCVVKIGRTSAEDGVYIHALLNMTTVLAELGRHVESLHVAKHVIRILAKGRKNYSTESSLHSAAFHNLAVALQRAGKSQSAVRSFRAAAQLSQKRSTTPSPMNVSAFMEQSYTQAVRHLPSSRPQRLLSAEALTTSLAGSSFAGSDVEPVVNRFNEFGSSFSGKESDAMPASSYSNDKLLQLSMHGVEVLQPRIDHEGRHSVPLQASKVRCLVGTAPESTLLLLPLAMPEPAKPVTCRPLPPRAKPTPPLMRRIGRNPHSRLVKEASGPRAACGVAAPKPHPPATPRGNTPKKTLRNTPSSSGSAKFVKIAHGVAEVSGLQDGFDFPDDVSNGYLLSDGQLGNLREKVRAELETKLAEGHMLSSEELVILKDMATKSCADF